MGRLLLAIAVGSTVLGCDSPPASLPPRAIDTQTPEGKFDWVMQRFERAVLDFGSSQRSGLRIGQQKVDRKLIPPTEDTPYYTAVITVSSEKEYVPEQPIPLIDKKEIKEQRRREMRKFNKQAGLRDQESPFDPLDAQFDKDMEELAAERGGPILDGAIVESPVVTDVAVYELAYQEDRWQLKSELEKEYEKLWFEYALQTKLTD